LAKEGKDLIGKATGRKKWIMRFLGLAGQNRHPLGKVWGKLPEEGENIPKDDTGNSERIIIIRGHYRKTTKGTSDKINLGRRKSSP